MGSVPREGVRPAENRTGSGWGEVCSHRNFWRRALAEVAKLPMLGAVF